MRKNIEKNDILDGIPLEEDSVDLVFLDSPYWKMTRRKYSHSDRDLANLTLQEFYKAMNMISKECWRILKQDGYVALLMGTISEKAQFIDLAFECYNIFIGCGFQPAERIIVAYTNENHSGLIRYRARKHQFLLRNHRDLIIMKKNKTS